jgi:chorismate dehydratase
MPTPLRIGNVGSAFTNAEPYRLIPPDFPVEWVNVDPSELTTQMAAGTLDCALLPTGALPQLGDAVRPLGPYGIACRGRVLSLRLFSHVPLAKLIDPGRKIFVTPRSTTTRALLSELFVMEYGVRPALTETLAGADAALFIGNDAMDFNRAEFRWPVSRDMCEWWFEQTGLSFVFAQWTVSRNVTDTQAAQLRSWIEANLALSETPSGRVLLEDAGVRAGWSAALARLYFDRLDFRLNDDHAAGLLRFQQLLAARAEETKA